MNTQLVEGKFGHGYLSKFLKPTDWQYTNFIPKGTAPFDWNAGYDVEQDTGITLPDKDQGQAGSCGGEMMSYFNQILSKSPEQSAKFIYAPVAQPGGGSYAGDLCNRAKNVGISTEVLCPSYINGQPPTEAFMEQVADITPAAISEASTNKIDTYSFIINFNIDTLAQAIRDNKGMGGAVMGQNNSTWLSAFPKPPTAPEWGHFIYFGRAKMINGLKYIGFKNSWGPTVGEAGWQWIGEDYVNSGFFELGIVMAHSTASYTFNNDLHAGMTSADVYFLQKKLNQNPATQIAITGPGSPSNETYYFGNLTKQAVIKYQQLNNITPAAGYVGPITRAHLNS